MTGSAMALLATQFEVTADWLDRILANATDWSGGAITSVVLEPIGGGDALASAVFHARATRESGTDAHLLVKMQTGDSPDAIAWMYESETYFYNHYARRAGVPVPQTYFAAFDSHATRFHLIQEFLTDATPGTATEYLSDHDLLRAITNLADLHAAWWDSSELLSDTGVRRIRDLIARSTAVLLKSEQNPVPGFLRIFGDQLPTDVTTFFESMPLWRPLLIEASSPHATLIHADCSAKNTMLPSDPSRPPVLIDWAFFHSGMGPYDLAVLSGESASPESQENVSQLLEIYLERLRSLGVQHYGMDELRTDFVHAVMFRSYSLLANATFGTPARLAQVENTLPSVVALLQTTGALDLAKQLLA